MFYVVKKSVYLLYVVLSLVALFHVVSRLIPCRSVVKGRAFTCFYTILFYIPYFMFYTIEKWKKS